MKRIFSILFVLVLAVSLMLVPAAPVGASPGPGLVGLWHFDGDANDSSGYNNHGTVYGATYVSGKFGQALSFDGIDDYVEVAHAESLDMTSAYTIEAWVNVTDVPSNIYRPIVFRGTTNANDIEVYVQAISDDLVVAHNRGNGGTFDWVRFADPPIGTLFHLVVTFDGTNVQVYYNGIAATVNQGTTAMVAPLDTDKDWWIGKVDHTAFGTLSGGSPINLFKGLIDEVRIWDEAVNPGPVTVPLYAGQTIPVGTVSVGNDGNNLYVKYQTEGDWCLSETHLHVATSLDDIPQKNGNPPPGQFDYKAEHDCITQYTYTIPLLSSTPLYIAAHAVVQKVITEAPYYASTVVDSEQGETKGGRDVREERSTPEQGLAFESEQDEFNFFSLGFGGWIVVQFDCPIRNGDGDDVQIIEDTWGTGYPLETANVSASPDGTNWTLLGEADNTNQDGIHTTSEFDLGALSWAKYIKVVDTTNPEVHGADADGYDLNAVVSLQDCIQEETAWGDGLDFPGKNWATYFMYHVQ